MRNYFLEQIKYNYLVSKKHNNVCNVLNYIEYLLILVSAVTGCVAVSVFAFSVGIPIGIINSTVGLKICSITAEIRKYKSIITTKRKNHDKVVSLAKT